MCCCCCEGKYQSGSCGGYHNTACSRTPFSLLSLSCPLSLGLSPHCPLPLQLVRLAACLAPAPPHARSVQADTASATARVCNRVRAEPTLHRARVCDADLARKVFHSLRVGVLLCVSLLIELLGYYKSGGCVGNQNTICSGLPLSLSVSLCLCRFDRVCVCSLSSRLFCMLRPAFLLIMHQRIHSQQRHVFENCFCPCPCSSSCARSWWVAADRFVFVVFSCVFCCVTTSLCCSSLSRSCSSFSPSFLLYSDKHTHLPCQLRAMHNLRKLSGCCHQQAMHAVFLTVHSQQRSVYKHKHHNHNYNE